MDQPSFDFSDRWETASDIQTIPLHDGWLGIYNPTGPGSFAVLNQPAFELWSRFQQPQKVASLHLVENEKQTIRKLSSAGLLVPHKSANSTFHIPQSTFLSAWLHLTDRCNLRCSYCYLPHVREDMPHETACAAVNAVFRSAVKNGYQQIKLKYAGGEPLLRFPLIIELHQYVQELAEENNLELDGVVLSNGTLLTEEIVSTLQSLNLRLMISLDGVGGWHNTQRPFAGDRGSFEEVASAIETALANDLIPHISITISGRNAAGLPEIISWVLERDLPFSINFYRQNDFSIKHEDLKLEEEKIIRGMQAAFEVIEANLPEHSLLASLTDRANLAIPHNRTCSVGQDYLVFNQHGQVAKCQMQMNKPVTNLHAEDPLELIREDQIGLQNISVDEKDGCRDCKWKNWCAGGCPLETYHATRRYDVKSPNCNIYKAIFPEVLRLEGLRLLKQANELEIVPVN